MIRSLRRGKRRAGLIGIGGTSTEHLKSQGKNMFSSSEYQLLDFGRGRRLERFGDLILDRLCPVAQNMTLDNPSLWEQADARFLEDPDSTGTQNLNIKKNAASGVRGEWFPLTEKGRAFFGDISSNGNFSSKIKKESEADQNTSGVRSWCIHHDHAKITLELKGSPFGHLGVFPEQSANWDMIFDQCRKEEKRRGQISVLNLFAYTGGSTLAAASAGAKVTHLDAAKNIVQQGRRNAEFSFPDRMPEIHWITDDAVRFVNRERKRQHQYDGIILDPPSYGHGAHGEVWRISRDLPGLMEAAVSLLNDSFSFILLTCHTRGFEYPVLKKMVCELLRSRFDLFSDFHVISDSMSILSLSGKRFPAGDRFWIARK